MRNYAAKEAYTPKYFKTEKKGKKNNPFSDNVQL